MKFSVWKSPLGSILIRLNHLSLTSFLFNFEVKTWQNKNQQSYCIKSYTRFPLKTVTSNQVISLFALLFYHTSVLWKKKKNHLENFQPVLLETMFRLRCACPLRSTGWLFVSGEVWRWINPYVSQQSHLFQNQQSLFRADTESKASRSQGENNPAQAMTTMVNITSLACLQNWPQRAC